MRSCWPHHCDSKLPGHIGSSEIECWNLLLPPQAVTLGWIEILKSFDGLRFNCYAIDRLFHRFCRFKCAVFIRDLIFPVDNAKLSNKRILIVNLFRTEERKLFNWYQNDRQTDEILIAPNLVCAIDWRRFFLCLMLIHAFACVMMMMRPPLTWFFFRKSLWWILWIER